MANENIVNKDSPIEKKELIKCIYNYTKLPNQSDFLSFKEKKRIKAQRDY
jgi:hypothetical protein